MKIHYSFIFVVLIFSCANPSQEAFDTLSQKEKSFFETHKTKELTQEEGEKMIKQYQAFEKQFPQHKELPEIYLKKADIYQGYKKFLMALKVYEDFTKKFPQHKKVAYASFMKGFVCDQAYNFSKYDRYKTYAIDFYSKFIQKYPKHPLAKDARGAIKYLNESK